MLGAVALLVATVAAALSARRLHDWPHTRASAGEVGAAGVRAPANLANGAI
jgi:hypothetical protein